ncbi:MAG: GNAT family N-acetyltransferase [Limisphaerales bacterium]
MRTDTGRRRTPLANASQRLARKDGTAAEFGIQLKSGGELSGLAGLDSIDPAHASAELSFLLLEGFWGQGYATKAAARQTGTGAAVLCSRCETSGH